MARPCGPCSDKRRTELDRRLLEKDLTGESFRRISEDFGYSETALRRHLENHIAADVGDVREAMIAARKEALAEVKAREREEVKEEIITGAKESTAARLENAASFIDQLREVRDKAAGLLDQAEASQDMRAAGTFLRELREQIRLMAELEGRIASQPQINLQQVSIYHSPQWREVGAMLAEVLNDYPDLRGEIAARLKAMVQAAEAGGQDGA